MPVPDDVPCTASEVCVSQREDREVGHGSGRGASGARAVLALHGGEAVRDHLLPYGGQTISEQDVAAVAAVLGGPTLTTGPQVAAFEQAFARRVDAEHAVAVNNGSSALLAALHAVNIGPGDEVLIPAMTFVSTAMAVVWHGATPLFVDVDPQSLLVDPAAVERAIGPRTRALVSVDYAGQPCDYEALRTIGDAAGVAVIADACHALGAEYRGRPVGSLADLSAFSFHPVKPITTGEGGMVTTDDPLFATRVRQFRNHCMTLGADERSAARTWAYEVHEPGWNLRLSDMQCALGLSQLGRLDAWIARRTAIAARYDAAFAPQDWIRPLARLDDRTHGYHLYVVRLDLSSLGVDRATVFQALRAEGIGVNVHYVPPHLQPVFRSRGDVGPVVCPNAEQAYEQILTLPIFPRMTDADVDDVVRAMDKIRAYFTGGAEPS